VTEELLTIQEVGQIYRRSEGAIRTALWRQRRHGIDPGIPLPMLISGRYRWLGSAVAEHFQTLQRLYSEEASKHAVPAEPQSILQNKGGAPPET
jgi:hypothetical protein